MSSNFHIGTSGWSYKDWKTNFYPPGTKSTDYIKYYATRFEVTEINSSFYHLPRLQTVKNWVATVPSNFKFCPKISQYITHMKKLNDPEAPLQRFFDVFDKISEHLGPVLIQLPKSVSFNREKTEHFFKVLSTIYAEYEFALEVREESWFTEESLDLMKMHNIAFVISHSGGKFPLKEFLTSKNVYIRFHGPAELYASKYDDKTLEFYAKKCAKWIKEGHIIWAFFNNDIGGHAVDDASRLRDMIQKKVK